VLRHDRRDRVDDAEERQPPSTKACTQTSLAGVEHRGRRAAAPAGRLAQRHRREGGLVQRLELPGSDRVQSRPYDGRGSRSGQASPGPIGSRMSGGLAWATRGAVHELDHRVHHRLRVHHDVDPVVRHAEQQVRLDEPPRPLLTSVAELT
jgi:hypothetical protein